MRRAINYAIDRAKIAQLLGQDSQPDCQILPFGLPGYRPYCPYTIDPNPSGAWKAPDLAKAEQLIAASGTRGTPITIWNLNPQGSGMLDPYLVSLLDRLGYPTRVKDISGADPTGPPRFADSRTGARPPSTASRSVFRTRPHPKSFKPTTPANRSRPTRQATQTGRSSATTASTPRSTARSQPRATTPPTPQHSGRKPTTLPPTKPQPSP